MSVIARKVILPSPRKLLIYGAATGLAWPTIILWQMANGRWLIDGTGRPLATNVLCIWSAGRMALAGQITAIYDPQALGAVQHAALARDFPTMPWVYPPTFLLASLCLGVLPYLWACATWLVGTGVAYVAAIRVILPYRLGVVLALAAPAVLVNTALTETGFAIAALAGAALIWLDKRPILAGIALGCLTFKPQFGLLFPLVLIATGRWRVCFSAAATALGLAALIAFLVGSEVWSAFLHSLPASNCPGLGLTAHRDS